MADAKAKPHRGHSVLETLLHGQAVARANRRRLYAWIAFWGFGAYLAYAAWDFAAHLAQWSLAL